MTLLRLPKNEYFLCNQSRSSTFNSKAIPYFYQSYVGSPAMLKLPRKTGNKHFWVKDTPTTPLCKSAPDKPELSLSVGYFSVLTTTFQGIILPEYLQSPTSTELTFVRRGNIQPLHTSSYTLTKVTYPGPQIHNIIQPICIIYFAIG